MIKIRCIQFIITAIMVLLLFSSCSQSRMLTLMATTPDLVYDKSQTKGLNNYQKDAIYLIETIKQAYPRLGDKLSAETLEKEKNLLLQDLSRIDNNLDFEIRLQKFIALLKDGHSKVTVDYPTSEPGEYPVAFFKEKDRWVLANINRMVADSSAIGCQVISVNGIAMEEIEFRAGKLENGENEFWTNLLLSSHQRLPSYWKALEVTAGNDYKLDVVIIKEGEEKLFTVYPDSKARGYQLPFKPGATPFTKQQNEGFYYKTDKEGNYAYLQMNTCLDYVSVKSEIASYTHLFIRPFALAYLKKQKKDARNFGLTLQSLFKEINEKEIDNLIIDLRNNTGGDERTGKQLLWYLDGTEDIKGFTTYINVSDYFRQTVKQDYKKYNRKYREKQGVPMPNREVNLNDEIFGQSYFDDITQKDSPYLLDASIPKFKGKVYVLIGNMTFSAAQMLATTIADNKLSTMIGHPTGNKPTGQTGFSLLKLPHTKNTVTLSYMFMERPDHSKNEERSLFPDIEISSGFQEFINGTDVGFEYIMREINKE